MYDLSNHDIRHMLRCAPDWTAHTNTPEAADTNMQTQAVHRLPPRACKPRVSATACVYTVCCLSAHDRHPRCHRRVLVIWLGPIYTRF